MTAAAAQNLYQQGNIENLIPAGTLLAQKYSALIPYSEMTLNPGWKRTTDIKILKYNEPAIDAGSFTTRYLTLKNVHLGNYLTNRFFPKAPVVTFASFFSDAHFSCIFPHRNILVNEYQVNDAQEVFITALMVRFTFCFAIVLIFCFNSFGQTYGLIFNSHEVVLEKRTALDLAPDDSICVTKNFEVAFSFNFIPHHEIYFGYLLRLICSNQNIDLMYYQPASMFNVITGDKFSGISFSLDSLKLYKEWNQFNLKFDLDKKTLECRVNSKLVGTGSLPPMSNSCIKLLWGANDFQKFKTRDIPPMQVRDIKIFENDNLKYFWPLDEKSGDTAFDKISHRAAKIKNPVWAKPKYQNWETIGSFTTNGYTGAAFDAKQNKLFITCSDSIAVFSLGEKQDLTWIPSKHQNLVLGHQSIYDTIDNRLLDVYADQKKVTSFDFNKKIWDYNFPPGPVRMTEYWHGNKFISRVANSLYFIGGYGYLRYRNSIQRYNFSNKQWDSLKPSGDYLPPKYLAALGADPEGKFAYILGGYGSQTGDQMLDPRYYYDFFRYNVKENSMQKLFTIKTVNTPFTFANSLIIDTASNSYYGLIFPNDSYQSHLQLIKGSLTDSTIRYLGDSISYEFHDVQSYADLYYSPASNKLIAVTMLYSPVEARELVNAKEKHTQVKVYTLNFPPEPLDNAVVEEVNPANKSSNWLLLTAGVALALVVALVLARKKSKPPVLSSLPVVKQEPVSMEDISVTAPATFQQNHIEKHHTSSIFMFGQFQVFDREGHDILRLFTPLLKELFLVISIYTIRNGRGISSEGLKEILWHDKSDKDANNNRSVNLAKLKVIFEKIGNCGINKDSGNWQFQVADADVQVDYKNYVSLLQSPAKLDKEFIHSFADIVKRGGFLAQTEYKWLDDIKSEISNSVIDNCLGYINSHGIAKDPEFIIEIANYIFYFDPLNEDALAYKCKCLIILKRHTLANNCYQKFIKDYRDIYGEDFSKSFHDIIT